MLIGERGRIALPAASGREVAIARAVLMDPPVCPSDDEPTSAMDFLDRASVPSTRIRQYAAHKTMIIVTHRTSLYRALPMRHHRRR